MKKILCALVVIAGIAACNSPQQMTASGSDTGANMMKTTTDTTGMMQGDTMKKDQ